MRCDGRIDPGRIGGVLTGHPGVLSPVRIDATSEMLSAVVRDFGCVAICSRIAESGAGRPRLPDGAESRRAGAAAEPVEAAEGRGAVESSRFALGGGLVSPEALEDLSQAPATRPSDRTRNRLARNRRRIMCRRLVQCMHRNRRPRDPQRCVRSSQPPEPSTAIMYTMPPLPKPTICRPE